MSGDMSDDEVGPLSVEDWQAQDPPSPNDSSKSDIELDDPPGGDDRDAPAQPIQKRRRVTRACDECRRKKIKCDGKQPCTHCSVYSYECTYDKPSNRRRNPAPQYIEALEGRLQRAETLLRQYLPNVNLEDPNLDPSVQQEFRKREQARAAKMHSGQMTDVGVNDPQLMSMIDSIGQLDLDDKGGWDFHGISSGTVFLKRMKEHFRVLLGPATKLSFLPRAERGVGLMSLDSPSPGVNSPLSTVSSYQELPPKDLAKSLCYYSLSCATCLVRVVHVPTFYEKFEAVYDKPAESRTLEEIRFTGLIYSVLALGCMYNNLDQDTGMKLAYKAATEEGFKYYKTARAILQDMTECRDLTSLQALLFMTLFLQATSNLNACYAFVGIALRSSVRMGLHRHLQHQKINTIEQETRSRVFYVIRQMDIYVSTLLGFPVLLNLEDVDQRYPTEVNDEFLTPSGILAPPPGMPSFFQAFNAHTRLMEILVKIMKYVYPLKGLGQSVTRGDKSTSTYMISYGFIKEIENDLRQWYERLPEAWRPSADGDVEVVRVRHLLRFAYAHVQLVLYRPFLHYISPRLRQSTKVDELSYACAAAAISVSRNIIHIGLEIRKQRVLSGPYWFMLYTEYIAVLSLVFYAMENPERPGSAEVLADAHSGRQMIADLANKSQAADLVTTALNDLFEQLPDSLDQARLRTTAGKKRSAPVSKVGSIFPHQGNLQSTLVTPIADDRIRSRGGPLQSGPFGSTPRSSVDTLHTPVEHGFPDPTFATMQDIMPLDLSSRATPDSTSTRGSSYQPFGSQALGSHPTVNKLESLMFPSEDPFAYPNQPMMELGYQPKGDGAPTGLISQGPNPQFFLTRTLEDIDTQLLGQPPPYVMQAPPQPDPSTMLSPAMYDPNSFLGMPSGPQQKAQQPPPQPQHPPPPPPTAQATHRPAQQRQPIAHSLAQQRRAQQQRIQDRIDQMFEEQGMQPDFGSFFGSGRGGFQGM